MKLRNWYRYSFKYWVSKKHENSLLWVVSHLPREVVYRSAIRVAANATTGAYSNQIVPELNFMDALDRWAKRDGGDKSNRKIKHPPVEDKIQWWKNGDHPKDRVGEQEVDFLALAHVHPELFDGEKHTSDEIPADAPTYTRLEGAVVRFFRRHEPEFSGVITHESCGYVWHLHGWIDDKSNDGDGTIVCPGDWVKV
jgi:hypothetical protein